MGEELKEYLYYMYAYDVCLEFGGLSVFQIIKKYSYSDLEKKYTILKRVPLEIIDESILLIRKKYFHAAKVLKKSLEKLE